MMRFPILINDDKDTLREGKRFLAHVLTLLIAIYAYQSNFPLWCLDFFRNLKQQKHFGKMSEVDAKANGKVSICLEVMLLFYFTYFDLNGFQC